ncbi:MAG TPA: hypothetical protein VKG79_08335 [Bryobacteraceae bacterium]|nr:hypothetical protein [Bryobacteraceae bacterium]
MPQDENLKSLDAMIASLGGSRDLDACELVLEHLQAARRCLLGSMPGEYSFNLRQTRDAVGFIEDKTARAGVKKILFGLYGAGKTKQRPSSAAGMEYALASPVPAAPAL